MGTPPWCPDASGRTNRDSSEETAMIRRSLTALSLVALTACARDLTTAPADSPAFARADDGTAVVVAPGLTVFFDPATFLHVSGAAATVTYPAIRGLTPAPYVENGVSFVQAAGFNNRVDDLTPIFPGNELGVSGAENVDVTFDTNPYGFGIWMQDGWEVGYIAWSPPQDSQFDVTFYGAEDNVLGTVRVDPPLDAAYFLGAVSAAAPIARVEFREVGSSIGELFEPYVENDFFGTAFTSGTPPAPTERDDCKHGQRRWYGFDNQGACIRAVAL